MEETPSKAIQAYVHQGHSEAACRKGRPRDEPFNMKTMRLYLATSLVSLVLFVFAGCGGAPVVRPFCRVHSALPIANADQMVATKAKISQATSPGQLEGIVVSPTGDAWFADYTNSAIGYQDTGGGFHELRLHPAARRTHSVPAKLHRSWHSTRRFCGFRTMQPTASPRWCGRHRGKGFRDSDERRRTRRGRRRSGQSIMVHQNANS